MFLQQTGPIVEWKVIGLTLSKVNRIIGKRGIELNVEAAVLYMQVED